MSEAFATPRVVLCEPEVLARTSLERLLSGAGIVVDACGNASEAALISRRESPDVVVASFQAIAGSEGHRLVDALQLSESRRNAGEVMVPIILITEEQESDVRLPIIVEDADRFMRPFNVLDLLARIRWHAAHRGLDGLEMGSAMCAFDLSAMDLADILQILGAKKKSGSIQVTDSRGSGSVTLNKGEIVHASDGSVIGKKAFFRTLRRRVGRAEFREGPARLRTITGAREGLLMEGMQYCDEYARACAVLPPAEAIIRRSDLAEPEATSEWFDRAAKSLDIPRKAANSVLRCLEDGPHTLNEVLDLCAEPDAEIARALAGLLLVGALESDAPQRMVRPFSIDEVAVLRDRLGIPPDEPRRLTVAVIPVNSALVEPFVASFCSMETATRLSPVGSPPLGPLATLKLDDNLSLDILALPCGDSFAPLWKPLSEGVFSFVILAETESHEDVARAIPVVKFLVHACAVDGLVAFWGVQDEMPKVSLMGPSIPCLPWSDEPQAIATLLHSLARVS